MRFKIKDLGILMDLFTKDSTSLKAKAMELHQKDLKPFFFNLLQSISTDENCLPVLLLFRAGDDLALSFATVKTSDTGADILEQKDIAFNGQTTKNIDLSELIIFLIDNMDKVRAGLMPDIIPNY